MMTNHRFAPHGFQPAPPPHLSPPEITLKDATLNLGSTNYLFLLRANPRGLFLRITEKSADAFGCLIIPAPGLEPIQRMLAKLILIAQAAPPPDSLPAPVTLQTEFVMVEKKHFILRLEADPRGSYLSLLERVANGHVNEIFVLFPALADFNQALAQIVRAARHHSVTDFAEPAVPARLPSADPLLQEGQMQLPTKSFTFQLRENERGRYLHLVQAKGDRLKFLRIPGESLEEFKTWVVAMAKAAKSARAKPARNLENIRRTQAHKHPHAYRPRLRPEKIESPFKPRRRTS
jgi:hypothetical protein